MKDKIFHFIARRLPSRLVYWCAIHLVAHATTGKYDKTVVPDLTAMDAVKRFGEDKGLHA